MNINKHNRSEDSKGSPSRFGYEWNHYDDLVPVYEEQFKRWTINLKSEDWKDKRFLDVGCGMGRNSYWPFKYGASSGVSIDLDDNSLESARNTLRNIENIEIRKLSVYEIDYVDEFDIVFSIGVIHHLSDPEKALASMVKATKNGGQVLIWVYGLENNEWIVNVFNPFRKLIFKNLPIGLVHFLSLFPSIILWLLLRFFPLKIEYYKLLRTFTFKHLRSIVFDQMLPNIANYWSKEEVIDLMSKSGLKNINAIWVNEMSWSVIGTK